MAAGARAARNATITDVAREADVSIKTVSRVFNGEPNVRNATRERVMAAAQALDYHPNVAARSLAGRRSFLIGLAYDRVSSHFVQDLQAGVAERLVDERYRLMVIPFIDPAEAPGRLRSIGRAAGLDGLILVPPISDEEDGLAELEACGLPYVRLAPHRGGVDAPDISTDDRAAAQEVVDHLVELGHARIAIVIGNPHHASAHARLDGYRSALARHGLEALPDHEAAGDYGFGSGLAAGRALLALPCAPTAIFASNDDMAAGVLSAAHEVGVPVPARLSIVGFDDSTIAEMVWPRLTTVRQPIRDMAHAATDALLAAIDGRPAPTHIVLPHRLVVRGSAGPCAERTAPGRRASRGG